MGFLPKRHRLLPCAEFYTINGSILFHNSIISKEVCRVFVLRCQSTSHLTYLVSFHRVTCHIQFIQSCKLHNHIFTHSYIHTFTHSYVHTLILSHIHTQHIHNINSYMVASVTQSFMWSYPFVSVLNCFKLPVLNNRPLEFTFFSCSKLPVLNNGPLEFTFFSCSKLPVLNNWPLEFTLLSCFKLLVLTMDRLSLPFILFQAASPKRRTAWVYFLSCFKLPVLNNGPLEFTFHHGSNGQFPPMNNLKSHFVFSQVSSPVRLVKGCLIHVFCLHTATIRVVGNLCHLSSYDYLTGSRQCLFHLTYIRLPYG
jgi:hypothetical protein